MPTRKGKRTPASESGSTAQSTTDMYWPPWEIDAFRHQALGRMMAGLALSLLGIVLGLISPAVAAQSDYAAPNAFQLGAIGLVAMVLVLVLLALLRKSGQGATNRQYGGHDLSVGRQPVGSESSASTLLEESDILRSVHEQFERCQNQKDYLGVLRIGLDHGAKPDSNYVRAALRETVASIAKSRGALLLPAADEEFVVVLSGDLPDQALRISNDFREAVADLALPGPNEIMTASVGLFVARPEVESRPEYYLERAVKALEQARSRGGNRVESKSV